MTKFEKIKEIIKSYQEAADKHYKNYKEKEKKAREKYSESGFKEEFVHGTWVTMAGQAWANADAAVRDVMDMFDEIEQELHEWVMKPLSSEVIQFLNCISNFELGLSLQELQIIEQSVKGSYIGTKIFAGLAEKNGYLIQTSQVGEYLQKLKTVRADTEHALRAYAGQGPEFLGRDLLQEKEYQGVNLGEYSEFDLFYASNFLRDGGELDSIEAMWNSVNAPMTYLLTESERQKVKRSLEQIIDKNGQIDKQKAQELVEKQPTIKSKLESMSQEDFAGMEAVTEYFSLYGPKKEKANDSNDSKISPSMQVANEYYNNKRETVDEEILNQFR